MRTIVIAAMMVAGVGLASTSASSASPGSTSVLKALAAMDQSVTQVRWRCHARWRSWWHWCY
jgi:hypothetical protein